MAAAVATAFAFAPQPASSRAAFSPLVDEYLDQFARRHPSIAAGNGLHAHDDALEDFSAGAIASEIGFTGFSTLPNGVLLVRMPFVLVGDNWPVVRP